MASCAGLDKENSTPEGWKSTLKDTVSIVSVIRTESPRSSGAPSAPATSPLMGILNRRNGSGSHCPGRRRGHYPCERHWDCRGRRTGLVGASRGDQHDGQRHQVTAEGHMVLSVHVSPTRPRRTARNDEARRRRTDSLDSTTCA